MQGIDVRKRKDGTTVYQAHVWDSRNQQRIRKTFANKTAGEELAH